MSQQFWRPTTFDRSTDEKIAVFNRHKHLPFAQQRQLLPIYRFRTHILYALEKYRTVILISETGSGKSTQVPQFLHEAGWTAGGRCVVCTQPRRIAATSIASRVADEMGAALGDQVGYAVRFDAKYSTQTAVKFVTDGVLLRETLTDPLLLKYSVIMIDEAHERSLHSDILLGLLKKICKKRKDLRLIVTSATIDATSMKMFFETNKKEPENAALDTACIVHIQGRLHEVDVMYLEKPVPNFLVAAVDTVLNIHRCEDVGDVLVFLPGGEEIDSVVETLSDRYEKDDLIILPLYSSLPTHVQLSVFEPTPPCKRKVVVSTNIAETSLTIEGIRFVVDCGFVKLNYFNVESGVEALVTCPVSKAAARQRAGRAGRTQPGKCFRLMTEPAFDALAIQAPPEMQRGEIYMAVLQLKSLGIEDVLHFDFLSPPSAESMIYSLELLYSLGALDGDCKLTSVGEKMAEMPLDPRMAKSLLSSWEFGCSEEMLSVAAMCSVDHPFINLRARASQESKQRLLECVGEFVAPEGDHVTLLNIFRAFELEGSSPQWCDSMSLQSRVLLRAKEIRRHLELMLRKFAKDGEAFASCLEDMGALQKCLVSAYFSNAAKLGSDGLYHTIRGQTLVSVHPTSVYARFGTPPEWVIYNEVIHSKCPQIRDVTRVEPLWLVDVAKHYYATTNISL